jgi:hypothetical protein
MLFSLLSVGDIIYVVTSTVVYVDPKIGEYEYDSIVHRTFVTEVISDHIIKIKTSNYSSIQTFGGIDQYKGRLYLWDLTNVSYYKFNEEERIKELSKILESEETEYNFSKDDT